MDEKEKYIKELEEKIRDLEIKNHRLEIKKLEKNKRGAGAKGIPDKVIEEIFEKYCRGETVNDLAKEYSLSPGTIYSKIRLLKKKKQKRSYSKEEIDDAIRELINVVDIISDGTYECDSPVPKSYEELIAYYDKRVCGIDLKKLIKRAEQKYDTLEKFLKGEDVTFREPLHKLFNI